MINQYVINANGENKLLISLRNQSTIAFEANLLAEIDPFTPSKFAQCSAGLVRHFRGYPIIDYRDWEFNPNETQTWAQSEKHQKAFRRHCTNDPQAYITPQLVGVHLAAALNTVSQIQMHESDVNARDAWGYTPIMYALGCCNYHATIALQNMHGFQWLRQGSLNLLPEQIIIYGRLWLPDHIKSFAPIPEVTDSNYAIINAVTIHEAAYTGNLEAVKTLIELGVPIDIRSFNGSSPLLCACLKKQRRVCQYLLENGADPYLANYVLETPWHFMDSVQRETFNHRSAIESFSAPHKANTKIIEPIQEAPELEQTSVSTDNTHTESPESEQPATSPETIEEKSPEDKEDFKRQFSNSVMSGNFHSMVTLYFLMDKPDDLIKEILNSSIQINYDNRELITDWLKFNIIETLLDDKQKQRSYSPLLLMSITNKDIFLNYFKNQSSINKEISKDNYLLTVAARSKILPIFNWLLRHGATMKLAGDFLPDLRQQNTLHLKDDFVEAFEIFREKRRSEISENPKRIPNLLLYSLTTNNVGIIEDYFHEGLSIRATTDDGLSLVDIARLIDSAELEAILLKYSQSTVSESSAITVESTTASSSLEAPTETPPNTMPPQLSEEPTIEEHPKQRDRPAPLSEVLSGVLSEVEVINEADLEQDEDEAEESDPLLWFTDSSESKPQESLTDRPIESDEKEKTDTVTTPDEASEEDALANQWFASDETATQDSYPLLSESESQPPLEPQTSPDANADSMTDFFFSAELEGSFFGNETEETYPVRGSTASSDKVESASTPDTQHESSNYLQKIKLEKATGINRSELEAILFRLPFPKPLLRLFIKVQDTDNEKDLGDKIKNRQTLELFWMFKLYVDRQVKKD